MRLDYSHILGNPIVRELMLLHYVLLLALAVVGLAYWSNKR